MSIGVLEVVVLVPLVFVLVRIWRAFERHRGAGGNGATFAANHHGRLQGWARNVLRAIRGELGWPIRLLALGAIVFLLSAFPVFGVLRLLVVTGVLAGVVIVFLKTFELHPFDGETVSRECGPVASPVSPPTPPRPVRRPISPAPIETEREEESPGWRYFRMALMVALFGIGALAMTATVAVHRVSAVMDKWGADVRREIANDPELRAEVEKWIDDPELRSTILPPPIVVASGPTAEDESEAGQDGLADSGYEESLRDKIADAISSDATEKAASQAREAIALVSDEAVEVDRGASSGEETVVAYQPDRAFAIPVPPAKVIFTTQECSTQSEADEELVQQVSRFLAIALARSGRFSIANGWSPDLDWTARNFAPNRMIHQRQDAETNASFFIGDVTVDVPDEPKVEQIWKHYLDNQAAQRSVGLLKGYAGGVFLIGGMAILLRLGTGRRVRTGEVSYGDRGSKKRKGVVTLIVLAFAVSVGVVLLLFLLGTR